MANEIVTEKLSAAIEASAAELKEILSADTDFHFSETEISGAVAKFRTLVPEHLEKGMPLSLAILAAKFIVSAITTHPHVMMQLRDVLLPHSSDYDVQSQLFQEGTGYSRDICLSMMRPLAISMGITRKLTLDDFSTIVGNRPLTYERFPLLVFNYFRAEIDGEIAAKTTLLN